MFFGIKRAHEQRTAIGGFAAKPRCGDVIDAAKPGPGMMRRGLPAFATIDNTQSEKLTFWGLPEGEGVARRLEPQDIGFHRLSYLVEQSFDRQGIWLTQMSRLQTV